MRSKKSSKIIIGVIALILCVAVGYALFSETLNIEGTATASGTFDIEMTCESQEVNGDNVEPTCEVKENTVTTTSTLSKPTDAAGFVIKVTNNGTIPAKLTSIDSNNNKSQDLSSSGNEVYLDDKYLMAFYDIRKTSLEEGGYDDSYCDDYYCGDDTFEKANITLAPQESVYLLIGHGWVDSGETKQPALDNGTATMTYNITMGFTQATNE